MDLLLRPLSRHRYVGLLMLRLGVGGVFIAHGLGKLLAGTERWEGLGGSLAAIGLPVIGPAVFWGLMATLAELVGGILLVIGWAFRPALLALIPTMVIATLFLIIGREAPFTQWSHPLTVGLVFVSMFLIGPGKYSLEGDPHAPGNEGTATESGPATAG
jgi:putative oxidoreductase